MIYLDYSATTPVNEEVLSSFVEATKNFIGNPNSLHKLGISANSLIDEATNQILDILKAKNKEVIYTSGATESNNLAIKGICSKYYNRGKHIITTSIEHSSIIAPLSYLQREGFEVDFVDFDENGQVDVKQLESLIRDDTILVSIGSINSEVGVIQPIEDIAKMLKKYPKIYFHSDMTQSIGKINIDIKDIDLISFSAQKIYGLKGVGALIKNKNLIIEPIIHGGKSTTVYRSGTPALSLIVSLSKALRLINENIAQNYEYVKGLNTYLKDELSKNSYIHINSNEYCSPYILNISIKNIKPETMLHALESEDIYISTKTACSSKEGISKAVYAITKNDEYASSSIRISLSHLTTKEEINKFIEVLKSKITELESLYESN